jgi:hypothetical protein
MQRENVPSPPALALFAIFATYGGLLLVILTTLFWVWSGAASLGTFYLILGALVVMGIIAWHFHGKQALSLYHRATFNAAMWYYAIGPISLGALFPIVSAIENR